MVGDVPVRVCLDELRDSTEPDAARVLARERGSALLGTAGVASGLVAVAVDEQDADSQRGLELLDALIELARMDDESRGRLGARFLQEAATSIEALALLDGIAPTVTHGLTMAYARAEVEAPPALVQRLMGQIGPLRETGQLPFDPDTEIESLRPVLESEPWALHGILDERIGVFPDVARAAFAFEVACRDEEACGRIALYWLLDRSEEVRFGAAEGFLERALGGIVEPVSAALVPLLRNWMPADPARAVLDGALREARRRGRFAPLAHSDWRPERFVATLPDRVGSQVFVVLLEGGAEPAAALVAIKAGRGIGEAFVVSGAAPMAAMPGQDGDGDLFDVPRDAFEAALAAAIAEGLESGRPPPAGLIDVARACGLRELRPRTMTARDWLEEVDPEGHIARLPAPERDELVEASEAWPERYAEVEAWSEGTAVMQQALEDRVSSEGLAAAFWARVEEMRNDWAKVMLRAAHVLKGAGEDDWRSFAATAMSLLDGRALATVPVLDYMFGETASAWLDEQYGRVSDGDDGTAELNRLIGAAEWPEGDILSLRNSAWTDGYVSAAVLSPEGAGTEALIAAAMNRSGVRADGGTAKRLATALTARHSELEAGYNDAQFVAGMFTKLDERGMRVWAQGLALGVGILDTAWPTEDFTAGERQSLDRMASLAQRDRVDLDMRLDVVKFIQMRMTMRGGGGA